MKSVISFASKVPVVAAVMRSVRARIIAHRLGNVLYFVDSGQAPALIFGEADECQDQETVDRVERMPHGLTLREIAFRPALGFESRRAPGCRDGWKHQQRCADPEKCHR